VDKQRPDQGNIMVYRLTTWHYIAYACYLLMGAIGFVGLIDEAGVIRAGPGAGILGAMLLAVVVPSVLILSVILRKERLLLLLAGLTIGIPLALWAAAAISPQDQSIAGWYIVPSTCVLVVAPAIRLLRNAIR
jgi:hypothetical protein